MMPSTIMLSELNEAVADRFVAVLADIFEHSPWVPARAVTQRPFADVDALHAAMTTVVDRAGDDEKLALLRAHPELAGHEAQQGTLSASSAGEQERAGLNALTREELIRIGGLNDAYRARHGFPFIICVGHHTKDSLMRSFERRVAAPREVEIAEALLQVSAIARLRLERLIPS